MSHKVLITRRQSLFNFFANPGRGGPQQPVLAGAHGTSNFDHQSLIYSDLNYTTTYLVVWTFWHEIVLRIIKKTWLGTLFEFAIIYQMFLLRGANRLEQHHDLVEWHELQIFLRTYPKRASLSILRPKNYKLDNYYWVCAGGHFCRTLSKICR